MPSVSLTNQDLFGIALSISGFLHLHDNEVSVSKACEHFDISQSKLRKLISTLFTLENLKTTDFYFDFDLQAFDERGILRLNQKAIIGKPPKLSNQQVSALAMGLEYLASFEVLAEDEDLQNLMTIFGANQTKTYAPSINGEKLSVLREAVSSSRQINCEYINTRGERARRTLEPLRIDLVNSVYYLRAYCPKNLQVRSFRLDRMKSPEMLDMAVSEKANKALLADEVNQPNENEKLVEVEVDLEAKDFFRSFSSKKIPKLVDGKLRGEVFTGDYSALARHVISRAGRVRVTSPKEAVQKVHELASSFLDMPTDED
jgi:proteasome accessory factor C